MHLTQFTTYLRTEKRYSDHTITSYQNDLIGFFDYIYNMYEIQTEDKVETIHIRSYLSKRIEEGISNRSVNRQLSALKSYFKYCIKQNITSKNPVANIPSLKTEQKLPSYVEVIPINQLLDSLPRSSFEEYRDFLLIYIIYAFGIRRAELINLKADDIDKRNLQIKVIGKGKKQRQLPMDESTVKHIDIYEKLKEAKFGKTENLLTTDKGKKMYPGFVYRKVKQLLSVITTQQKKSPHTLRHSFATHLLNKGADIMSIKELLGHESLQATQVYTHTNIEELKKIYNKTHPSS